jgi:hypothetical protein
VELHDLFAETYGFGNDWARVLYMGMINRTPRIWRVIYRWLDRQEKFAGDFRVFFALKNHLRRLLARLQPDVVVSVYPAYPHMLDELLGWGGAPHQTSGRHHGFDQRERDLYRAAPTIFSSQTSEAAVPRVRHSTGKVKRLAFRSVRVRAAGEVRLPPQTRLADAPST